MFSVTLHDNDSILFGGIVDDVVSHLVHYFVWSAQDETCVVVIVVVVTPALVALQLKAGIGEITKITIGTEHIGYVVFNTTGRVSTANVSHPIILTAHGSNNEHFAIVFVRPTALQDLFVGCHEEESL